MNRVEQIDQKERSVSLDNSFESSKGTKNQDKKSPGMGQVKDLKADAKFKTAGLSQTKGHRSR